MKVGLLGAGRIGELHAGLLRSHPGVDAVVVSDPVRERAVHVAAVAGGIVAETPEAVIEGCDALVIASSTDTHEHNVTMAMKAGRPTLCEKPLAPDLASSVRTATVVRDAGVPVQVGFNRRFDTGFRHARDRVADGSLGQLLVIVGQHHDHRPPPAAYVGVSGGQVADQLIHDIDLVRYVSGREVTAVHAAGADAGMALFGDHDDTAVTVLTLWLEGGALATLTGVRMDPVGYDVRMDVFGTGESLAVGLDDRTPIRSAEVGGHDPADPHTEWTTRFGQAYTAQLDAFLAVARGEAASPCTVDDAVAASRIVDACQRALAGGGRVTVEPAT